MIDNGADIIDGHKVIPTNSQRLDPNSGQSDRFFDALDGQYLDSESKLIEFLFEEIRVAKGIDIGPGVKRSDLINSISEGVTLDLKIYSEMKPCVSCSDILDNVGQVFPNSIEVSGGTLYHNNHLTDF